MVERAVICVGNRVRSDDAIGLLVADELARRELDVPVHVSTGEPAELMELWADLDRVVVVDAVQTGLHAPGTLHVLAGAELALEVTAQPSSHGIGLAESIALGRSLNKLPTTIRVVGIEIGTVAPGLEPSAEVRATLPAAVERVLEEIGHA